MNGRATKKLKSILLEQILDKHPHLRDDKNSVKMKKLFKSEFKRFKKFYKKGEHLKCVT